MKVFMTDKIIDSIELDGWMIESDEGWVPINYIHKTKPFIEWLIRTQSFSLVCADTHIVFDSDYNECFVKDLIPNESSIITKNGIELVLEVSCLDQESNMYDFSVNSENERYWSDGILSHNTTTMVAYVLWATIFNEYYSVAILANKGSLAREILGRYQLAYENLPPYLQQGVVEFNKGKVELENGSKIVAAATSSSAIRGSSYNLAFLDEFAHIQNNLADDFLASVFPTISSGKEAKLILSSTPRGLNTFYKYWIEAKSGKNGFVPFEVHWSDVPGRDEAWKRRMIESQGIDKFRQEYDCEFLGSSNTLVKGEKIAILTPMEPIKVMNNIMIYEEPIKEYKDEETGKTHLEHIYIVCVDISEGKNMDYSAFSIFDVSVMPYKQVATYRNNALPPILFPTILKGIGEYYNMAHMLIEVNNSPQVADLLVEELAYENVFRVTTKIKKAQTITLSGGVNCFAGVKMSPLVKRLGCSMLKTLVENNKLIVVDEVTIKELSTFTQQGPTFKADIGCNDDMAMTLVLFSWLTTQDVFKEMLEYDLRKQLQYEQFDKIEEDLLVKPVITMGAELDDSYVENGDLWSLVKMEDEWNSQTMIW